MDFESIQKAALANFTKTSLELPQWGGTVTLRELSARDKLDISKMQGVKGRPEEDVGFDVYVFVVQRSVIDGAGNRIFSGSKGKAFLEDQPLELLQKVGDAALALSGLDGSETEQEINHKKKGRTLEPAPS